MLSKAIEMDPDQATPYYIRGRVHFQLGKIKESVQDFDAYILEEGKYDHVFFDKAREHTNGNSSWISSEDAKVLFDMLKKEKALGAAKSRPAHKVLIIDDVSIWPVGCGTGRSDSIPLLTKAVAHKGRRS